MADLRERLARSRLALPEGDGWERGVPGRWLSALLADWQAFDVSRFQARMDKLTHLRANLDGQLMHLVHMPGRGPDPVPAAADSRLARLGLRVSRSAPAADRPAGPRR